MKNKISGANLVGNIFLLDKHIGPKLIIIGVLTTFFIALFKFLLASENISKNFTINELVYSLLGVSVLYILVDIKLIYTFFKEYFVFNFLVFVGTIFEIILFLIIISTSRGEIQGWIFGIFWLFSGLLKVLIQFSKAIFISDIQDYLKIIQVFAYSRAAYFAIAIIYFSDLFKINLPFFWLLFLSVTFLIIFWFIANLYPYMKKHQNVRNVVMLMRIVKEEKIIKINKLRNSTDFSDSYFDKMLERLSSFNFLKIQNKRVQLGEGYKYIYRT